MRNDSLPPQLPHATLPSAILNTGHSSSQLECINVWLVTTGDSRPSNGGYYRRSPTPIRFAAGPVSVSVQTPRKAALIPIEEGHTRGANLITIREYIARRQCIEDGLPLLCTVPSVSAEGEAEARSHCDSAIALSRLKRALGPRRTPPSVAFVEMPTRIVPRHPTCL